MKIAVIVPAYNEELTIEKTLKDLYAAMPDNEIWVINNNSNDNTNKIVERVYLELNLKGGCIFEARQGKAFAVRTGFHQIEADYYAMIDADATYPAHELNKLLKLAIDDGYEMVIGDRHSGGDYSKVMDRQFHNFGNLLVSWLINNLFRSNIRDIMSGFRVFSRGFVKSYPILCDGFEIETEMTIHALDKRFKTIEVPISFVSRPEGSESKLNTYTDGIKILKIIFLIFKDYYPLRFFGFLSLLALISAFLAGAPVIHEFVDTQMVRHIPLAILATGLMIFSLIFLTIGLILDTVVKNHKFNYELSLLQRK